jgi:hypothetical protein
MSNETPFGGNIAYGDFIVPERGDRGTGNPRARIGIVDSHYWATFGGSVQVGRVFTDADGAGAQKVAVVNDVLARRVYHEVNPIGRIVRYGDEDRRIVGVVSAMRMRDMSAEIEPELYLPLSQVPIRPRFIAVRSRAHAGAMVSELRRTLKGIDPSIPMMLVTTMEDRVNEVIAPQRFRAALVAALGTLATFLSALGLYGVLADTVNRQTREIGIRMALGEDRRRTQWRVVSSALGVTVVGIVIGVALALGVGQWLTTFLTDVGARDVTTLAVSAGTLIVVAIAAAFLPAHRASRVDVVVALRADG